MNQFPPIDYVQIIDLSKITEQERIKLLKSLKECAEISVDKDCKKVESTGEDK